ncbi:unnamed protein product, partial [Polarella glacialis]
ANTSSAMADSLRPAAPPPRCVSNLRGRASPVRQRSISPLRSVSPNGRASASSSRAVPSGASSRPDGGPPKPVEPSISAAAAAAWHRGSPRNNLMHSATQPLHQVSRQSSSPALLVEPAPQMATWSSGLGSAHCACARQLQPQPVPMHRVVVRSPSAPSLVRPVASHEEGSSSSATTEALVHSTDPRSGGWSASTQPPHGSWVVPQLPLHPAQLLSREAAARGDGSLTPQQAALTPKTT